MIEKSAAKILAALGHESRLSLFRLLVKSGHDGLNVGEISLNLSLAPSTLSHHLSALVEVGLVHQTRVGREVRNCADFEAIEKVVNYLMNECCQGVPVTK